MKTSRIILASAILLGITSCSKETPFDNGKEVLTGKFAKSALAVSLENESGVPDVYNRPTRAGVPDVNDFTVEFYKVDSETPEASYKYSEMPEIVVLPVGDYTARASYGENLPVAWENPYYKGESDFTIKTDEITDDVDPIVCRLSNVRVSVVFDKSLLDNMSDDSKVTVYMGEGQNGKLEFTAADSEKSGYFAYVQDSNTLAAVFNGEVEGYPTTETKAYNDVQPGNHYRITFSLHQAGEEDPGNINGTVNVDATVTIVDMNQNIDFDDDPIEDDMRPVEGGTTVDPEPGPGGGDEPTPPANAPAVTSNAGVEFGVPNYVTRDGIESCIVYVHSEAGIDTFTCDIESPDLTEEELAGMGLSTHLDIATTPDGMASMLQGLGFAVNVKGQKEVALDISSFLGIMATWEGHQHIFHIKVTDANGETSKDLILQY